MNDVEERETITKIYDLASQLVEYPAARTPDRVDRLINAATLYREALNAQRRRAAQASDVDKSGELAAVVGDITSYASDLEYHAARLERPVRGTFNRVELIASPGDKRNAIADRYFKAIRDRSSP